MTATLNDLVKSKGYVVADGAMGTQLFAAGLSSGWSPEEWNLSHSEEVRAVHRGYLQAGADLIVTNSFGGNCFRQSLHGFQRRVDELNQAAAHIGRLEADTEMERSGRPVLVAGSMGPTGELLAPLGTMELQACEAAFAEQSAALAAGGVDLLWIETMSALDEVEAAVRAARSMCDLPVAVTMSFDTAGCTMMGVTGKELVDRLGALELAAIGANCGNNVPDTEAAVIAIASAGSGTLTVSKPNAGVPIWRKDALVYDGTPELLAAHAHRAHTAGVGVIGSCCGSTPAHTERIVSVLAGDEPPPSVEVVLNPQTALDERLVRRRPRRRRNHG
ncbi:homocysteine S-methyltransferase family protein [Candidatus Poriferisodalis sp.]|uniref:homocysteine S-methyltransferase family protein n=1 Tax=Candidatus Poriferisodalis sp. TaxID=3101277 RepID=UPI003AF8DEA7